MPSYVYDMRSSLFYCFVKLPEGGFHPAEGQCPIARTIERAPDGGRSPCRIRQQTTPSSAVAIKQRGAWLLFLPPYSPDLNPIELAFSKLKAHMERLALRTVGDLWKGVCEILELFSQQECTNLFKAAGYGAK